MANKIIQAENFDDFKLGDFPYDPEHSAMGEYHYYPPNGYRGNWYCPITDYSREGPFWTLMRNGNGHKVIECQILREKDKQKFWNVLTTGDELWQNYTVTCLVQRLKTTMLAGIGLRYQNSRCMYVFCLNGQKAQLIELDHECAYLGAKDYTVLAEAEVKTDCDTVYRLEAECDRDTIHCRLDGRLIFSAADKTYSRGRAALIANCPARFGDFTVSMDESESLVLTTHKKKHAKKLAELRQKYSQPKLWEKINFKDFGAGRNIRFGDLNGDGRKELLIAQCRRRVLSDRYANISCLTAIDMKGNILWQQGDPDPANAFLTADLPMQICDIDGDGDCEVIIARDFKIQILDGSSGKIKKWIYSPFSTTPMERLYSGVPYGSYAFDRVNIDCIRICNFSGKSHPSDILVKDRYSRLWAYDCDLNLLWFYNDGITGHFPLTKDLNGDGRDEIFVGYNLLDADGNKLWALPVPTDHTDEIVIGKIDPERDGEVICIVSGNEGFMMADLDGHILKKDIISHAQRISVGNYRPELPGFEIAVTTFWFNQGIIRLYNCKGELLHSFEPGTDGNIIAPVNWTGDGRDLILLNGNVAKGGIIDGEGNQVVIFPDDGHPELCCETIDLTGDCRDEIALWDEKGMWVYTQDRPFTGSKIFNPEKYPDYNASNYRGEYSWPKWKEI
jgi:rhamnogalacturonan endolyase